MLSTYATNDKPNIVFSDRGQGFYAARGGKLRAQYKEALREHSLKAYNGDDASKQPGNLQEVLLHETAVSWIRRREAMTRKAPAWKETVEEFAARIRDIVQDINCNLNVEGLCRSLPKRLQQLVDNKGDRITH